MQLIDIYRKLLSMYGPQGWWPLMELGDVTYKQGSKEYGGYHPGDYSYPKTERQVFEICLGAVLTQNVSWVNVVKALRNLEALGAVNPGILIRLDDSSLKEAIRPAGYYNQKARKLKAFAEFFTALSGRVPTREELLGIWGIGRETADSMLLYAFKVPVFVVDAYTRRIFANIGHIKPDDEYDRIRAFFEKNLDPDARIFQEYHALIVEHAKRYYLGRKESYKCPLSQNI